MDDWTRRDLPLMEHFAAAEIIDEPLSTDGVAEEMSLELHDVWTGCVALREAGYVTWGSGARYGRDSYNLVGARLQERGRRALRLWPADSFDAFIAVVERLIAAEQEPTKRSKLETLRDAVKGVGREAAGEVIGGVIRGAAGI